MAQIAGDEGSAEWKSSRPASRGKVKAAWLADAIARADLKKKKALTVESAEGAKKNKKKAPRPTARSVAHATDIAAASKAVTAKEAAKAANKPSASAA